MGKGHYDFLDHTADMAFRVEADGFAALLATATRALGEVFLAPGEGEILESRPVTVSGADPEDVVVAWLQEAVVLLEDEGWVVRDAEVRCADAKGAEGVLHGRPLEPNERPDRVVKAVTYHDLRVERGTASRPWRATIVLDL